jgi:hypothetical protein
MGTSDQRLFRGDYTPCVEGSKGNRSIGSCPRTIVDLNNLLSAEGFFQVNRSTIINLDNLVEIIPWFSGTSSLRLSNEIGIVTPPGAGSATERSGWSFQVRLERPCPPLRLSLLAEAFGGLEHNLAIFLGQFHHCFKYLPYIGVRY